jgi:shikimate kinase
MNIVLVGFMGTGKSAVGAALAERLGRPLLDTDALIEQRAGRPIAQIFAAEGEAAFRDLETAIVAEVAAQGPLVIATGGGVLGRDENVARLKASGRLVCLTAHPDVILTRTAPWEDRPLLASAPDPRAAVERLLQARAARYALADVTVDTSDRTVVEVADQVLSALGMTAGALEANTECASSR